MAVGGRHERAIGKQFHAGVGAVPLVMVVHEADAVLAFASAPMTRGGATECLYNEWSYRSCR